MKIERHGEPISSFGEPCLRSIANESSRQPPPGQDLHSWRICVEVVTVSGRPTLVLDTVVIIQGACHPFSGCSVKSFLAFAANWHPDPQARVMVMMHARWPTRIPQSPSSRRWRRVWGDGAERRGAPGAV